MTEDNDKPKKLRIGVIFGGRSAEHEVSLRSARAVLAALDREKYDLILMDVQMPELDGLATTRVVRERERANGTRTPILAMTAYAMEGDREKCMQAGMDAYVSKPVRAEALELAILALTGDPVQNRPGN